MRVKNTGFTLIELTVVLLIVVMGFTVIASNISSGNQSSQLKATARDLSSAFRYARGQALISHKEIAVTINLAENSYQIEGRNKTFEFSDEIEVTLVIAEEEFNNDDETASIRFYADGSSSGGRVNLDWGKLNYQIDINWLTGQVEITS